MAKPTKPPAKAAPAPPAAPVKTVEAKVQPASGTPPVAQNCPGVVCPKTAPAPKGMFEKFGDAYKEHREQYLAEHKAKSTNEKLSDILSLRGGGAAARIKTLPGKATVPAAAPKPAPPAPAKPAPASKPVEPAATPKTASGTNGGHVMAKKKVDCFKAGDKTKNKTKEYDKQLADQEKGLNDMTVQEYLDGRKKFDEIGRKGTGAAQQAARADHAKDLTDKFTKQLSKQGVTGAAASQQAAQMTANKMNTLAALHNPDMIAGGKDAVTAMGDRGVNSSIGGQWKDKVKDLDASAKQVPESERATTKMNVKLSRCP